MNVKSANVEALIQDRGSSQWRSNLVSVQDLCNSYPSSSTCTIAFIGADSSSSNIPENVRKVLNETFNIPSSFWSDLLHEASGFFGTQDDHLEDSRFQGYSTFFRFLVKEPSYPPHAPNNKIGTIDYRWHELGFFTQWRPSTGLVVLCFDLPSTLQKEIREAVLQSSTTTPLSQPFVLHATLLEHIINLYNKALWAWRDYVRQLEKHRATLENPEPDYEGMHEIARHIVHSSEMLDTAITVVNSMLNELSIFISENEAISKQAELEVRQTSKAFRHHTTVLKCLHKRSQALEKRLQNEINLAFNIVAHHNSHVSTRIAEATQVDSAAMKAISFLGFAFLPGTFICAIFSTTFFDLSPASDGGPEQWTVSNKFWIYWAVAIPVTITALLLWLFWQRRSQRQRVSLLGGRTSMLQMDEFKAGIA